MLVLRPPEAIELPTGARSVFLAGSIETGKAIDWQEQLTHELAHLDVLVLNPRRTAWDASWRQSIDEPEFRAQVEWELTGLDRASAIAMWFAPETAAPITLLELGLHVASGRLIVGCPDGYWRKGNVDVVCARHGVPVARDWDGFVSATLAALSRDP